MQNANVVLRTEIDHMTPKSGWVTDVNLTIIAFTQITKMLVARENVKQIFVIAHITAHADTTVSTGVEI